MNRPGEAAAAAAPPRALHLPVYAAAVDWNLRTCGRRGHVTYVPDEPDLRARLIASTPLGEAWRCLRCGDYVLGRRTATVRRRTRRWCPGARCCGTR
jgi:hypothetical protein